MVNMCADVEDSRTTNNETPDYFEPWSEEIKTAISDLIFQHDFIPSAGDYVAGDDFDGLYIESRSFYPNKRIVFWMTEVDIYSELKELIKK